MNQKMPTDTELRKAQEDLGIKAKNTLPKYAINKLLEITKTECPVCKQKGVWSDIGFHGPEASQVIYGCGCNVTTKNGVTSHVRYDGKVVHQE